MAQLKSTIVQGNLTASGSILASKVSILNGGSNQILMANGGTIDIGTLTPLTSHNSLTTTVANVSAVANAADTLSKANAAALPTKLSIDGSIAMTGALQSNVVSTLYSTSCNGGSAYNVGPGSYTGWIGGYTKDGRMAISTYRDEGSAGNNLLFVYMENSGIAGNSVKSIMRWSGPDNSLTATTFIGALQGNASTATQFYENATVELTGDITGSASSKKGWTISTSLPSRLKNYQSTAIADANDVTESGFHYMGNTSAGGGHRPPFANTTNDYRILATGYSSIWAQQIATNYRSNEIFFRRIENGTWKDWVQIQTTESADARYVNVTGDVMTGDLTISNSKNLSSRYFVMTDGANAKATYWYNDTDDCVELKF